MFPMQYWNQTFVRKAILNERTDKRMKFLKKV